MDKIQKEILNKIKQYDTIVISHHVNPDGDAVGSSLGLREALRLTFPEKKIYSVADERVKYLEFFNDEDENDISYYDNALGIVVDTANMARISNQYINKCKEIIKIDHHIPVEDYGVINYVLQLPAACLIVMKLILDLKLKLNDKGAKALYIGTVTDTSRFRFEFNKPELFELVGEMTKYNLDTQTIYANLYTKTMNELKLQGEVITSFKMSQNGVAYVYLDKSLQEKYGLNEKEVSNMIGVLDSIKGSLIWIAFIDYPDCIRVRIRSRYITIDKLANKYEGGGHAHASGATVHSIDQMNELIQEADEMLKQYKLSNKEAF